MFTGGFVPQYNSKANLGETACSPIMSSSDQLLGSSSQPSVSYRSCEIRSEWPGNEAKTICHFMYTSALQPILEHMVKGHLLAAHAGTNASLISYKTHHG